MSESTQGIGDRILVPCPKLITILGDLLARVISSSPHHQPFGGWGDGGRLSGVLGRRFTNGWGGWQGPCPFPRTEGDLWALDLTFFPRPPWG